MTAPIDDEHIEFFTAIGRGVTLWADIEYQLSILYTYLMGDITQAAQDSFYSVNGFRNRLRLVDTATRSGFYRIDIAVSPGERLKTWANIHNNLKDESDIRNKLAHHKLVHYSSVEIGKNDNKPSATKLVLHRPHIFSIKPSKEGVKSFKTQIDDILTIEKVHAHLIKVEVIASKIRDFTNPLQGEIADKRLKLFQELSEQSHDPMN